MNKTLQAKHVPDEAFLAVVDRVAREERRWTLTSDLEPALGVPRKVILAKARALIRRGVIDGCGCGCRGDFVRKNADEKAP